MTHTLAKDREYTGGEQTICGGGGETEARSKNNSTVQIGTTTTGNPPSCDTVISFDRSAKCLCVSTQAG